MSIPFVRAALLCEKLVTDNSGLASVIHVFDRLIAPEGGIIEAQLVLMLVSAEPAEGEHHIVMHVETEEGLVARQDMAIAVPPEAGTCFNFVMPLRLEAGGARSYWISLAWDRDDQLLTKIPLTFRAPVASEAK